jgi:hypothetical protein
MRLGFLHLSVDVLSRSRSIVHYSSRRFLFLWLLIAVLVFIKVILIIWKQIVDFVSYSLDGGIQ